VSESNINGKVVWVTGASSGIGEALCYQLAKAGATLVLSSRREDELRRVQAACARPDAHMVLPLDMLHRETFDAAVKTVLERFGRIDILVHSAGQSQRGRAADTIFDVDRRIMELNFFGPVALTKLVLPSMRERRAGHIVVISSLLGKFGAPDRTAYSASKHALHGFFDSLRAELFPDGISVTIICPGFVHTNASRNALNPDGTRHGEMDRDIKHGLAPEVCARKIVSAIERRSREVYIAKKERLGVFLTRFAPGLFARIIRRAKLK
jgi:short-subunit dehydrogenase